MNSDRQREKAELAILLTLEESTKPMRDEALAAGFYHHPWMERDVPRIQIVTIREMIEENRRIDLPMSLEVLKTAAAASMEEQHPLDL